MSLEDKIDALTAAIDRLTVAMNSREGSQVAPAARRKRNAPLPEDIDPSAVKDSGVKDLEVVEPAQTAAEPTEPPAEVQEISKIDYSGVVAATTKLVRAKGRDAALDLLKTFGVSNAKQLREEEWASYISKASTEI